MSSSIQTLPVGTVLRGRVFTYAIEIVLGQGAFGITYLASTSIQGPLGKVTVQVALKEFFAKELDSRQEDGTVSARTQGGIAHKYARAFKRESENLSKMTHPGIVNVLEAFEDKGTYYYSMEYLSGGSLDEKVKGSGIPEKEALRLIGKIGEALSFMHDQKVMHLDLKPKNIMLKGDGSPVIIDFGLSKQYDDSGEPESSSNIGLGTPGYAPIEQANQTSGKVFQPTLDIYALGATLYKMLTGVTPPVASEILNEGFPEELLQEKSVSRTTVSAIDKAMSAARKNRPQSVEAFLSMLDIRSGAAGVKNRGPLYRRWLALYIAYSNCFVADLGPDGDLHIIDTCKTDDVPGYSRDSLGEEHLEHFVEALLTRFSASQDFSDREVCFIVPSHFDIGKKLCVRAGSSGFGIERVRILLSDYACAIGYLVQSGAWENEASELELGVVGETRPEGERSYTVFQYEAGVLEEISYLKDAEDYLMDGALVPGRHELNSVDPARVLLGALSYMKVLVGYDGGRHLMLESLRGGPLQLRWGRNGDSFKTIIPDGYTIPAKISVKITLGDTQIFDLYQHGGIGQYHGYLATLHPDMEALRPRAEVVFSVDIGTESEITLTLTSDGKELDKRIIKEPYRGETRYLGICPYLEVSDDETIVDQTTSTTGHQWVDLGLPSGVKWATCNVGASRPEEYGDYFAWGETAPKEEYTEKNYKFLLKKGILGIAKHYSKYDKGNISCRLDAEDDVVRHKWGSDWRMPTEEEWRELRNPDNCLWEWKKNYNGSGVDGYLVSGIKEGYTEKTLFLPAAGLKIKTDYIRGYGYYWSSDRLEVNAGLAWCFFFNNEHYGTYQDDCQDGLTIRPVTK